MTEQVNSDGLVTFTTPVITAFPTFFEAKRFKKNGRESGEPKFGGTFVVPPDSEDLANVKAAIKRVSAAKWPGRNINEDFKAGNFGLPLSQGDTLVQQRIAKLKAEGKDYDGKADFAKGMVLLKTSSKFEPKLAFVEGGRVSPDLEGPARKANASKFYFGVMSFIQVNLVPYDAVGNNGVDGVTAYLQQVVSTGVGKRLSGGASAAETFAAFAGKVSNENPLEGMDDEIPF